jgi:hypothetical protein
MVLMAVSRFERFFRTAAGVDDRQVPWPRRHKTRGEYGRDQGRS